MDHAFRLAGGARGVDEEQRELGIQRQRRHRSPDRAHEVGIGQGQQCGFVRNVEAGLACGVQQLRCRRIGQFMAPAVTPRAPHQVGLGGVAYHDHRFDSRRCRHQCFGHGRAHARGLRRIQPAAAAQIAQRPADAAHRVAALYRHFAGQRVVHGGQDLLRIPVIELERRQSLLDRPPHHRHRHVVVQCRIGVRGLERHDLRVAIAAVGGDDEARTGIVDAVAERLVRKAAEHGGVDHADALGSFGPVQLRRDVGQVQRDAVAGL